MDKTTKVDIVPRHKTSDNISNTNVEFEIKETSNVPSNTVCYVDDISIPHSWYSIETLIPNFTYNELM